MTNETETIQNPTWEAEYHSLCATGWRLRLAYLSNQYRTQAYKAYVNHLEVCLQCEAYYQELTAAASQPYKYYCAVCHEEITGADIDNRHSLPDGEDCHEKCCPGCEEPTE